MKQSYFNTAASLWPTTANEKIIFSNKLEDRLPAKSEQRLMAVRQEKRQEAEVTGSHPGDVLGYMLG